ncbi:MAG: helix-turn-helix transcriptional regulator [Proteobacteria bacterium]|nr:helix-turn-helix transcriptional regulator [Pseudomonadota bacterium]
MRLQDLGREARKARLAKGLTQAALARETGLSRETLNLLENGLIRDLGIRKVIALLEYLGLEIAVQPRARLRRPDYVRMACTSANVGFKTALTEDELIHALITGKIPAQRSAHLRTLFDEAPKTLLNGLVSEASRWTKPGKLQINLRKLADALGVSKKIEE